MRVPIAAEDSALERIRATIRVFLSLGALALALTWLYLGMRSVMAIGGACAEGGPFVPIRPCPKGVPVVMISGIWGGLIALGFYIWQTSKHRVPSLAMLSWSALFLSLGWNFLEFGVSPPGGGGLVWGWLVCAILFGLMGGLPLLLVTKPIVKNFTSPGAPETLGSKSADLTRALIGRVRKATPAQTTPITTEPGIVDELERLDKLRRSGALTESEFEEAKRILMRGGS